MYERWQTSGPGSARSPHQDQTEVGSLVGRATADGLHYERRILPGALAHTLQLYFSINLKYRIHFVFNLWDLYVAVALVIKNLAHNLYFVLPGCRGRDTLSRRVGRAAWAHPSVSPRLHSQAWQGDGQADPLKPTMTTPAGVIMDALVLGAGNWG